VGEELEVVVEDEDLGTLVGAPFVRCDEVATVAHADRPGAERDVEVSSGKADRDRVVRPADPDPGLAVDLGAE
jgi:hypothetical protein